VIVVYDADVTIGRERVGVRLLARDVHTVLERRLVQADGTVFVHSIFLDADTVIYDYSTADPYFMQLERHYCAIQEKLRELEERRE
jgi:hypothetical protein